MQQRFLTDLRLGNGSRIGVLHPNANQESLSEGTDHEGGDDHYGESRGDDDGAVLGDFAEGESETDGTADNAAPPKHELFADGNATRFGRAQVDEEDTHKHDDNATCDEDR